MHGFMHADMHALTAPRQWAQKDGPDHRYIAAVEDPTAGAIATFLGVTRDNFHGKRVVQLQYEAYVPMARKVMLVPPPPPFRWRPRVRSTSQISLCKG